MVNAERANGDRKLSDKGCLPLWCSDRRRSVRTSVCNRRAPPRMTLLHRNVKYYNFQKLCKIKNWNLILSYIILTRVDTT